MIGLKFLQCFPLPQDRDTLTLPSNSLVLSLQLLLTLFVLTIAVFLPPPLLSHSPWPKCPFYTILHLILAEPLDPNSFSRFCSKGIPSTSSPKSSKHLLNPEYIRPDTVFCRHVGQVFPFLKAPTLFRTYRTRFVLLSSVPLPTLFSCLEFYFSFLPTRILPVYQSSAEIYLPLNFL